MRTTELAVKGIIQVDELVAPSLVPFIDSANSLVTELCVPAGYDDTRLELIERWLSAHFYAVTDPRLTSEHFGDINVKYQSKVDLHLDLSHYGQQAMLLDTAGALSDLNQEAKKGKPNAGIIWGGTKPRNSRAVDYLE